MLEETLSDEQLFMQRLREDQQEESENERNYRFTVQRYHFDTDGVSLEAPGERVIARSAKEAGEKAVGHNLSARGNRSELAVKVYRISDEFKPVIDIFYHPNST